MPVIYLCLDTELPLQCGSHTGRGVQLITCWTIGKNYLDWPRVTFFGLYEECCTFADIDECLSSDACGANSVCNNTVGSYRCECLTGFVALCGSQNPLNPVCVGKNNNKKIQKTNKQFRLGVKRNWVNELLFLVPARTVENGFLCFLSSLTNSSLSKLCSIMMWSTFVSQSGVGPFLSLICARRNIVTLLQEEAIDCLILDCPPSLPLL